MYPETEAFRDKKWNLPVYRRVCKNTSMFDRPWYSKVLRTIKTLFLKIKKESVPLFI